MSDTAAFIEQLRRFTAEPGGLDSVSFFPKRDNLVNAQPAGADRALLLRISQDVFITTMHHP